MGRPSRTNPLQSLRVLQASSLGYVLIRCGQRFNELGMRRVNREAGGVVLREAHTRLLPLLQDPAGVRMTDLARSLEVSKQAIQQVVSDLMELGVVSVGADPDDARARRVVLTELGLHAMEHGTGVLLTIEEELTPRLGRRQVRELHRALTALLPALEALNDAPPAGLSKALRRGGSKR